MKSKVKFIAFSDIQVHDWKPFSINHSRLEHNCKILSVVRDLCLKYACPALFCGDFVDDPKQVENYTLQRIIEVMNSFKRHKITVYAIDGNHDQCQQNSLTNRSPNYIKTLSDIYSNIIHLNNSTFSTGSYYISGIPYLTGNVGFIETAKRLVKDLKHKGSMKHILLTHADLPGAKEPNGREISHQNIPEEYYKAFKPFDLVLNGHIHKPQQLYSNVYTLGATHQQRQSDAGCSMGLWLIRADLTMEFVPLDMPQFKYIEEGEEKPNDTDFFIELPKNIKEEVEQQGIKFLPTHSSIKLATKYMKASGINSKKKTDLLLKYLQHARA